MLLFQGKFTPRHTDPESRTILEDAVESLVAALAKNGQIWGDHLVGWDGLTLRLVLGVPTVDALEVGHHSDSVLRQLARVEQHCAAATTWEPLGTSSRGAVDTDCAAAGALYLFTHATDRTSPIYSGVDGTPVPLFCLKLSSSLREELHQWMRNYRCHDQLQLESGALELAAYEQLANPVSRLSEWGRRLASEVEAATRQPTYYYLARYWGRGNGEATRVCPSCGGNWAQQGDRARGGLVWFDFRCDRCRLLFHVGSVVGDGQLAAIGEWQPRLSR